MNGKRMWRQAMVIGLFFVLAFATPAHAATYTDGAEWGAWRVVFAGYGSVVATGRGLSEAITLAPMVSVSPNETHAALVVSSAKYNDVRLRMRVTLKSQLRQLAPNPWETGWVVTRYADNDHFYYLALKTNGWELGKRDPSYPGGQRFLATGSTPKTVLGKPQIADLTVRGATITVRIDGVLLATFTDRERPYLNGANGMYTEDAAVTFDRVSATRL